MIEINANPHRLDLDAIHARQASRLGISIVINPDAHTTSGLADLDYGVGIARKAGLTAEAVFNSRPVDEVGRHFASRRNRA